MRKYITRTMSTSTIHGFKVTIKDGTPVAEALEPIVVGGKVSHKDATKLLKKQYADCEMLTVNKIDVTEDTYQISVDEFIKHAKKVDAEKESTDKAENA